MTQDQRITGIVLAGGRSRRMGTDKRFIEVGGRPLLERAVRSVSAVADGVLIVCKADDPVIPALAARSGARLVFDLRGDAGPLAGLEAGLRMMDGDLAVVVAGDMPWIACDVLRHLVDVARAAPDADAIVIRSHASAQPLLAAYRLRTLQYVEQLLDAGEHRAKCLLDLLRVRWVPPAEWLAFDPTGRSVANINEPRDLDLVS